MIEIKEKNQEIINISLNFIPTEDLLIHLKSLWKPEIDGIFKTSNAEEKNSTILTFANSDNKDQNSRLPDYVLKISPVFIHICLFIPLISNNFEAETGHF